MVKNCAKLHDTAFCMLVQCTHHTIAIAKIKTACSKLFQAFTHPHMYTIGVYRNDNTFHASHTVPQIVISPENTSTVAGSTTVLACVGYGSPSVTWSKDGAVLVNNSQIIILEDQVTSRGFTFAKSVLQLCDPQDVDSGQYSCSIQSVDGIQMNDSATFELSVTPNVGTLWV